MKLTERDAKTIWRPYTQMKTAPEPIGIVRGEGSWLYAEDGRKFFDATSSWWVNLHGHAHPHIARKIFEQASCLEHVIFAGFTHEPAVVFAEKILKLLPGSQEKLFYSDNGSTAVEVALKMAIQYWHNRGQNKKKFIVLEHSYHGDTFGAMSVSARSAFTAAFSDLLFEVVVLPFPDHRDKALADLKNIIHSNENKLAAFIFEPRVLGAGGMRMYEDETLEALIQMCRNAGIICIADEVMTGFGRTGKLFACSGLKNEPDIICLSKGITGGTMALGATTCTGNIFNAFLSEDHSKTFFHGHSYTANPLACTAAVASLDLLLTKECTDAIRRISIRLEQLCRKLQNYSCVENARNSGTILAFEIQAPEGNSYFNKLRDFIYLHFLDEGILMRPLGNTVYIMPPYCTSDEELQLVESAIIKLLEKLK